MEWHGALTYEPSFRLALTSLSCPAGRAGETALAVTLASLFDNRPAPNGRCAIAKWQELVPTADLASDRASERPSGEKAAAKTRITPSLSRAENPHPFLSLEQ